MYTENDFTAPFILINQDGSTMVFDSLTDLAAVRTTIDKHHVDHITRYLTGETVTYYNEWIVRDDRGKIVTQDDVREAARKRHGSHYYRRETYLDKKRHAASLGLPIPGTGHGRGGYGHYLRHPKTLQNNRLREAISRDERDAEFRVKGKVKLLPNLWDDVVRTDIGHRSWKRHRTTQWKD